MTAPQIRPNTPRVGLSEGGACFGALSSDPECTGNDPLISPGDTLFVDAFAGSFRSGVDEPVTGDTLPMDSIEGDAATRGLSPDVLYAATDSVYCPSGSFGSVADRAP